MSKTTKKSPKKIITKSRRSSSRPLSKSKTPKFSYKPTLITLAIIGLLYFGYRTLFRPTPIGINEVTGGTGTVTLALTPPNSTKAANTTRDITLAINAGTSHVTGAQIEITFDPAKCVTPTVTQGTFLAGTPLVPVAVGSGKITFTYAAPLPQPSTTPGISGSGTLATITTGPKSAACSLVFTTNTLVYTTENLATSSLASASDATISLPGSSPTPTPSPSPTVTPTPTPTPSVSPTPTASCPSTYTPAQCQIYLEKRATLQSKVKQMFDCLDTHSFAYCGAQFK